MPARNPLNVLFLTLYPNAAASPRYRVEQFIPYLRAHGIRCTVESALTDDEYRELAGPDRRVRPFWYHAKETPRRVMHLLRARRYDIVFVQKAVTTAYLRGLHALLRNCAKRIVYDIDDAVHLCPPHALRGIWGALEDRDQIRRILGDADLVLAGNAWLCNEARQHAKRVEFFPTVVDTDRFSPGRLGGTGFVVGWIGSSSTTPHLTIANAVGDIEGTSIRCVGANPALVPWKHADVQPWAYDTEVDAIRAFSAGIMPLPKDDWTRGKCALKALQYMACGVPCVATPHGAVLDIIADNVTGLFADSPEEWRAAVEWVRDPAARAKLGEAGRVAVESHFSLKSAAPKLGQLLESAV